MHIIADSFNLWRKKKSEIIIFVEMNILSNYGLFFSEKRGGLYTESMQLVKGSSVSLIILFLLLFYTCNIYQD